MLQEREGKIKSLTRLVASKTHWELEGNQSRSTPCAQHGNRRREGAGGG